ncbi:hypothetical protein UCMB321_1628 [Pseudomonas batumici]|uniref:Uncharacterized protein n=1 Tax=Pseudomonas batumici TaxID=226910 RepID=A0A0C2F0W0_9PSED|nr:hypothetical protein UCMB321_1628 [Pseudomonas batumici]
MVSCGSSRLAHSRLQRFAIVAARILRSMGLYRFREQAGQGRVYQ